MGWVAHRTLQRSCLLGHFLFVSFPQGCRTFSDRVPSFVSYIDTQFSPVTLTLQVSSHDKDILNEEIGPHMASKSRTLLQQEDARQAKVHKWIRQQLSNPRQALGDRANAKILRTAEIKLRVRLMRKAGRRIPWKVLINGPG